MNEVNEENQILQNEIESTLLQEHVEKKDYMVPPVYYKKQKAHNQIENTLLEPYADNKDYMVPQAYYKEKTVKNCFENIFVFFINNFPWL